MSEVLAGEYLSRLELSKLWCRLRHAGKGRTFLSQEESSYLT